jgi:nucleoside-diphosphate-sugar epimerase
VLEKVSSEEYYGTGYQDIQSRVPDIAKAREILGWEPRVGLREALRRTVAYYAERGAPPHAADPT